MNLAIRYPGLGHAALMTLAVGVFQVALTLPLFLSGAIVAATQDFDAMEAATQTAQHPATLAVINTVALGLVIAWGVWKNRTPLREMFPLRAVSGPALGAVALAVIGATAVLSELDNLLRWLWPVPEVFEEMMTRLIAETPSLVGSFAALVVVAPVTEELLFRGLVFRGLLTRFRPVSAILLSAGLFAVVHFNPWQFPSALVLGVLCAWWLLRGGSLVPCLLGHVILNAMALFNAHLPVTIPAYNAGYDEAAFQPWWFDLAGVALMALGVWLYRRATPAPILVPSSPPSTPPGPAPPIIRPPPVLAP